HQLVLGGEMRVEAPDGERGALHHVGDRGARDPFFPDEPRRGLEDGFVRPFFLFDLGVHLRRPRTGWPPTWPGALVECPSYYVRTMTRSAPGFAALRLDADALLSPVAKGQVGPLPRGQDLDLR